jgi:VCBS repeat-containing protein
VLKTVTFVNVDANVASPIWEIVCMNKSYKSIWNESLGAYVAVAEVTAAGGRKASSARKARRAPSRAHSGRMVLEPRIVFDAALPATVFEVHSEAGESLADPIEIRSEDLDPFVLEPAATDSLVSEQQRMREDAGEADEDDAISQIVASDAVSVVPLADKGSEIEAETEIAGAFEDSDVLSMDTGAALAESSDSTGDRVDADTFDVVNESPAFLYFEDLDDSSYQQLMVAQIQAQEILASFFGRMDVEDVMAELFPGMEASPDYEWMDALRQILADFEAGDLSVSVELRSGQELLWHQAAFSSNGTSGEPVIYLNEDWVSQSDSSSIAFVLVEEFGHFIDYLLNFENDTLGDEGERFALHLVHGIELHRLDYLLSEDDGVTLLLDGLEIEVELASYAFINAYEMVYDLNNDGIINTNERWSDKEQNTHYFNADDSLGGITILDGTENRFFSGNDVSATSIVIGGETFYGWISRPIKSGGDIKGFYFWTDVDFTSLEAAQADGNRDLDANVRDNRGFLLVVDQAWFDARISAGSFYDINNDKDGDLGLITVAVVGSSSDRVDTAFNSLINSNLPPIAADDVYFVEEEDGYAVLGGLLDNDSDSDGGPLFVLSVNGSSQNLNIPVVGSEGGLFFVSENGTIGFDPNGEFGYLAAGQTVTTRIEYTVSDGRGGTSIAVASVTVTGVNEDPVAGDDSFTTEEDTPVVVNVIANDTDIDDDTLTVTQIDGQVATVGSPITLYDGSGTATLNANGTITFNPAPNYNGPVSFEYQISDGNGGFDTATVSGTVNPVNDAPTSTPIANQEDNDGEAISLDVSDSFNDVDIATNGDSLTFAAEGLPPGLSIDPATGVISGTLPSDASQGGDDPVNAPGVYTVTVTATDSSGASVDQSFSFTIGNPAPDALDDGFTAEADAPAAVVGNAQGNDTDPDGDDLTVTAVNGDPALLGSQVAGSDGGLFTVNPDGTVSFDPNGEFDALPLGDTTTTTVTYTISDGQGGTDTATITVTVTGVNNVPVATDDLFTVGEDDAPAAVGNVITGDTGAGTDSDIDGGTLTVAEVNGDAGPVGSPVAGSAGGLFTVNPDGTVSFDPNGDFESLAVGDTATTTVTYTISDGEGGLSTATITVTINGANDAPEVVPGNEIPDQNGNDAETITSIDVTGAFTDVDNTDVLTYSATGLPAGLTLNPSTGIISGTLDNSASQGGPGSNGVYTVVVTANDGNGGTVSDTFTYTVGNPVPTATDNDYAVSEDGGAAVIGNALTDDTGAGTDSDPDGDTLVVTAQTGVAGSNGGVFSIDAAGVITFDPNGDFESLAVGESATTTLSYEISDGEGGLSTATITVTINGANDAPVATDDGPIPTSADTPATGNVLPNDSDIDGDTLAVTGFTVAGDPATYLAGETASIVDVGTLVINGDGSFTFTPQLGYAGPVPSATYTISDGFATDTAVLSFANVPVVPPAPETGPSPAPVPVPPPPTVPPAPAPAPAPDVPDAPVWEQPAGQASPSTPIALATGSALHVLYAVSEASNERGMFSSSLGSAGLDAALMGEALSQWPDSLMFDSSTWVDQVGLIKEPGLGDVQVVTPALHVQYAVRHQPIVMEQGLFVQHAVRSAQLESRIRNAMIDAHNSATPGYGSLLDPFALGAPRPEGAEALVAEAEQQQACPQQAAASSESEATPQAAAAVNEVPVQRAVELSRSAQGFRAQVERLAKDRLHGSRPITRSTTVKS